MPPAEGSSLLCLVAHSSKGSAADVLIEKEQALLLFPWFFTNIIESHNLGIGSFPQQPYSGTFDNSVTSLLEIIRSSETYTTLSQLSRSLCISSTLTARHPSSHFALYRDNRTVESQSLSDLILRVSVCLCACVERGSNTAGIFLLETIVKLELSGCSPPKT